MQLGWEKEGCAGDKGHGVDLSERGLGVWWLGGGDVAGEGAGGEVEFGVGGCGRGGCVGEGKGGWHFGRCWAVMQWWVLEMEMGCGVRRRAQFVG